MPQSLVLMMLASALGGCALLPGEASTHLPLQGVIPILPVQITTESGAICNGVRLNKSTVATAAHCISDKAAVTVIEFGQRYAVSNTVMHPAYENVASVSSSGVDLARLSAPINTPFQGEVSIHRIQPGEVFVRVVHGDGGYRDVPCTYLGRSGALVELSCHVALGWSGAPIIQHGALVGILSARGTAQAKGVAQMADASLLSTF